MLALFETQNKSNKKLIAIRWVPKWCVDGWKEWEGWKIDDCFMERLKDRWIAGKLENKSGKRLRMY